MDKGLGGKGLAQMEERIKAFSGATPGGEAYAKEFAAYNANPVGYGKVKVVQPSPQSRVQKAVGGNLGKTAQGLANRNQGIKDQGVLGYAFGQLFK